jgi:SAM-dependent methyltransferase
VTDEQVLAWLREEHARPFVGWDLSYIHGRRTDLTGHPWSLQDLYLEALTGSHRAVDVDTGDGRFVAQVHAEQPLPAGSVATEGYAPNVPIAAARLHPLGIPVVQTDFGVVEAGGAETMPFRDAAFDLVLNRHGWFDAAEFRRVLQPGGRLVTQQVGSKTNLDLHRALGSTRADAGWDLARARRELEAAGFAIEVAEEAFPITRYADAGAVAYYLKAIAWEIPDFDVDRYAEPLLALHRRIEREGHLDVGFHLFVLRTRRA